MILRIGAMAAGPMALMLVAAQAQQPPEARVPKVDRLCDARPDAAGSPCRRQIDKTAAAVTFPPAVQAGQVTSVDAYGSYHDGSSDDLAAIDAAFRACVARGGGRVVLGPYTYRVLTGNVTPPEHCPLQGELDAQGASATNDYKHLPYSILLNPAYTVQLGLNTGIHGVAIVNANLPDVGRLKGYQAVWDAVQGFAGTGMTIGGPSYSENAAAGDDKVEDVFILGFATCISGQHNDRTRGSNIYGDCTNGLSIDNAHDSARFNNVHFWPFFTQHSTYNTFVARVIGVSAGTANGSGGDLIRVSTDGAHQLAPGNVVNLTGLGGTVGGMDGVDAGNVNGTRTVAATPTSTTFDLAGTAFSGSYASGGIVVFDPGGGRSGTGFLVTNSENVLISNAFAFGPRTCVNISTGTMFSRVDVGCDDVLYRAAMLDAKGPGSLDRGDLTTIGVIFSGDAHRNFYTGPYISSMGDSVASTSTSNEPNFVQGTDIGATGGYAVYMGGGNLEIDGSHFMGGGASIYVTAAALRLAIIGGEAIIPPIGYAAGAPPVFLLTGAGVCIPESAGPAAIGPGGLGNGFSGCAYPYFDTTNLKMCVWLPGTGSKCAAAAYQ